MAKEKKVNDARGTGVTGGNSGIPNPEQQQGLKYVKEINKDLAAQKKEGRFGPPKRAKVGNPQPFKWPKQTPQYKTPHKKGK